MFNIIKKLFKERRGFTMTTPTNIKKVYCIDDSPVPCRMNALTKKKTYEVIRENEDTFTIKDDFNNHENYLKKRFIPVLFSAKCIDSSYNEFITAGKTYDVTRIDSFMNMYEVIDDNKNLSTYFMFRFEKVADSSKRRTISFNDFMKKVATGDLVYEKHGFDGSHDGWRLVLSNHTVGLNTRNQKSWGERIFFTQNTKKVIFTSSLKDIDYQNLSQFLTNFDETLVEDYIVEISDDKSGKEKTDKKEKLEKTIKELEKDIDKAKKELKSL